jgi:carboxypeptidase C (cathepsin A)
VTKRHSYIFIISSLLILIVCQVACQVIIKPISAQETSKGVGGSPEKSTIIDTGKEFLLEKLSVTHHTIKLNGKTLNYTATAGYMPMKDESGKLKANIFFVAYAEDEPEGKSERPISFAFNGGPGAASIFLHLGALGPKRILLTEKGEALPPPYQLVDNTYTWLDFTDLVFIDPVGTGYSLPAAGEDPKQFWGVKEDIQSIGAFIQLYLTKNGRWLSPKFIVGESYGTTRAAGLSSYLQNNLSITLNGIVLISEAINFQAIVFTAGNDLPYLLFLPSYTAAAWYHKKLSPDLQEDLKKALIEVEQFALNDYLLALAQGDVLSDRERTRIIERLARYTGLSKDRIKTCNLRISRDDFTKELLRVEDRRIGILDSRITGNYTPHDFIEDPSVFAVTGSLVATWNDYVRKGLKFETDSPYEILSMKANRSWNWSSGTGGLGYVNVSEPLRQAMSENKYLRVFIGSGYYDLDTPYLAAKYAVNHLGLDPSLRNNITLAYYDAGHQMYTDLPSLKKLKADVTEFFNKTPPN